MVLQKKLTGFDAQGYAVYTEVDDGRDFLKEVSHNPERDTLIVKTYKVGLMKNGRPNRNYRHIAEIARELGLGYNATREVLIKAGIMVKRRAIIKRPHRGRKKKRLVDAES